MCRRKIYLSLNFKLLSLIFFLLTVTTNVAQAQKKIKIYGKIQDGEGYSILLLAQDGRVRSTATNSKGKFAFKKISKALVKNATLQLVNSAGQYYGPVVLARNSKKSLVYTTFKSMGTKKKLKLGKAKIKSGYAVLNKNLKTIVAKSKKVSADADGKPLGAGKMGLVAISQSSILSNQKILSDSINSGADLDKDGIPNAIDLDDDGDLDLDLSDKDSSESSNKYNPFTTLYLSMSETIYVTIP